MQPRSVSVCFRPATALLSPHPTYLLRTPVCSYVCAGKSPVPARAVAARAGRPGERPVLPRTLNVARWRWAGCGSTFERVRCMALAVAIMRRLLSGFVLLPSPCRLQNSLRPIQQLSAPLLLFVPRRRFSSPSCSLLAPAQSPAASASASPPARLPLALSGPFSAASAVVFVCVLESTRVFRFGPQVRDPDHLLLSRRPALPPPRLAMYGS